MWAILGICIAAAELATPAGFWLVGVGVGAAVVAFLVAIGLASSAIVQWLVFAGASVAAVFGLRSAFGGQLASAESTRRDLADVIGEVVTVHADIPPAAIGSAELRGTVWRVRNLGAEGLAPGARARIESVEGVTLNVRRVEP